MLIAAYLGMLACNFNLMSSFFQSFSVCLDLCPYTL
jgi:hypothetical protein